MKKSLKVLYFAIIALTLLYIAFFIFLNLKGKNLIIKIIKDTQNLETSIGSFNFKFPRNIEISNFKCQAMSFEEAKISLGFFNPFTQRLTLDKVYVEGLDLTLTKVVKGTRKIFNKPIDSGEPSKFSSQAKPPNIQKSSRMVNDRPKNTKISVLIKNGYIKNSKIRMIFRANEKDINIVLSDVALQLKRFVYPELTKFYLKFDSSLSSLSEEKKIPKAIALKGWLDYRNKNMNMDVSVNNFDYFLFSDCYPKFWKPDELKLKEALLSLKSECIAEDNDLLVSLTLSLDKVVFVDPLAEDDSGFSKFRTIKTILALLKGDNGKSTLNLKFRTKMDAPKLDFLALKNQAKRSIKFGPFTLTTGVIGLLKGEVKENAERVVTGSIKDVIESSQEAGDITIDTAIETIKSVVDRIGDVFKRDD